MKNNQYKLLINNQQKQIIKEDKFSLEDTSRFLEDLLNTGTNLIKATVISLGAMWEHAVMTSEMVGFASLENINKRFLEKINEANKLYNEAVPESVRGDVDFLFNVNNPAIFIGKKVIDLAANRETREMYIPFAWSLRYIFSGEFFKNDVKDFGKVFGDIGFNNIIWYKGWFYRKLIFNNLNDLQNAINNGLLSKSGINSLKSLESMDDVIREYPKVVFFLRGLKAVETYHNPTLQFYDFCKRWNGEKFFRLASLSYYINEKDESIRFQYGDIDKRLKKLQIELSKERDSEKKQKIQSEIDDLQAQLTEFENITAKDPIDNTEFSIKDIIDEDQPVENDDIKVIGDATNPQKTAIDQQIEDVEQEIENFKNQAKSSKKTLSTADLKKMKDLTRQLNSLLNWKELLKRKYGDKYGDPTDTSLIDAKNSGKNPIADIKARKERMKRRLQTLDAEITKKRVLTKTLEEERAQLVKDFKEDFQNTAAAVFQSETLLVPNIIRIFTGDELYDEISGEFDAQAYEAFSAVGDLIGANIPPEIKQAYNMFKTYTQGLNVPSPSSLPTWLGGAPTSLNLSLNLNSTKPDTAIDVSWSSGIANVNIEYATVNTIKPGDADYQIKSVTGSATFKETIASLKPATQYFFRITDKISTPPFPPETADIKTKAAGVPAPPPAPAPTPGINLKATVLGNTDIKLDWKKINNAKIEWAETTPINPTSVGYRTKTVAAHTEIIRGLKPGTKYYFKITDSINPAVFSNEEKSTTHGAAIGPVAISVPVISWFGNSITTKKFFIKIDNFASYTAGPKLKFEFTITRSGAPYETFLINSDTIKPTGEITHISMSPTGKLNIADNIEVTCQAIDNSVKSGISNKLLYKIIKGRPHVKEYVLKIDNNRKMLIENAIQSKNEFEINDHMKDLKNMGLDATPPNGAEELILKNALDNKKLNKYTKQWVEAATLVKKSAGNWKNEQQAKDTFLKMVNLSSKFFGNLQLDFIKSMEDMRDEKSETNARVNKELTDKYGYELTPAGIVQKNHFNFELLCYTYRIYAAAYLSNIQAIFEENDLVLKLLNNVSSEELQTALGRLKNVILPEIDSILKDDTIKRFENANKDLMKILGEETQTYVDFKEQKEKLFDLIKDTKTQLREFINQIEKVLSSIKQLPEAKKLSLLIEAITSYIDTNEKNVQKIYNNFLPGLNKMQQNFKHMKDNAIEMDKNYGVLLQRLDDKILFSKIYEDNFNKFEIAYKKCIKFTGLTSTSKEAPLNQIEKMKRLKEEYAKKLESANEEEQEIMQQKKQKKAKKNDEEAVMTINNGQKEINPITTAVEDEE